MKKTVKTILVVLVLSILLVLGYKYFLKLQANNTSIENNKTDIVNNDATNNVAIGNNSTDIVINATTSKSNQTLTISKYFSNDFTIDRGDGSEKEILTSSDVYIRDGEIYPKKVRHTYRNKGSYNIVLSLLNGDKRRKFQKVRTPLIEDTMEDESDPWGETIIKSFEGDISIISMPSLADGFGESKEEPGDYFFANFNGAITGLPKGSFDTSGIKKVGDSFFAGFHFKKLPEGSFDISNITTVGDLFFAYFGTSELPEGSFDTSNITTVGNGFFQYFNNYGKLTELPKGSFNISKITTVGNSFFKNFNYDGSLTELPEGSFNFSNITKVGDNFFESFNENGDLTKLPKGSFDVSNITEVGDNFFASFNAEGKLTKLPEGSFDISNIRKRGKNFFQYFNSFNGKLSNVPDFENIRKNQIGEISYDKNSKTNIVININVVQSNQRIRINKYFSNDYNIDWGDGLIEWLTEDLTHTYEKPGSYDIILSLREGVERWTFQKGYPVKPLIQSDYTTIKEIRIVSMPTLVDGFGNSATEPGNDFFAYFNYGGAIKQLPEGSFDTSKIEVAGDNFFEGFNWEGALTELPEGSFDISNIKIVGDRFFRGFNNYGNLIDLPEGSFDISNIEKTGAFFLSEFNGGGAPKSKIGNSTSGGGKQVKQGLEKSRVDACVDKIKEYIGKSPIEIFTGNQSSWQIKCHTTPLLVTGEYYLQQTCGDNQQLCWLLCYNSGSDIIEHFATCGYDINDSKLINFYRDDQNNKTGLFEEGGDERFSTMEGRIGLCNQCSGLPEGKTWDWFQEIVASNSYIYNAGQETYNRTQCQIYFDGGKVTVGNKVCFPGLNQNSGESLGNVGLNNDTKEKRYFFYNTCVEDIKEHIRKNLGISGNIVEVVYNSSNPPRGTELLMSSGYYYITRDSGRMGWALYYKDAGIIIKHEDMSCVYNSDGELVKFNYNPDKTDLLKKLGDDRYLTTQGRISLCNGKTKKNRTMEILKPDYYTYVEIESRGITAGTWKTECRIHFEDGKVEIIDHMAEMNDLVMGF